MTLLIRGARYPFSSSRYELYDILEGEIVNDSKNFYLQLSGMSFALCESLLLQIS